MPLFTLSKRLSSTALLVAIAAATSLGQTPTSQANYEQAKKFNSDFLKQYVYGSAVSPKWIGKTEKFWYSYKTSEGTRYWLVDPQTKTKVPLFDCDLLAALLTEATEKARDADDLKISGLKLDKTGDKMTFSADKLDFEFIRSTGALTKKDKKKSEAGDDARERTRRGGTRGRRGGDGEDSEKKKEDENKERDRLYKAARKSYEEKKKNGGKKKEEDRRKYLSATIKAVRDPSESTEQSWAQGVNLITLGEDDE
ncbi:MAG: hypothetical protein CMJ83_19960, partial [Planctomycetes bacterium]|nr:hypothetical protein [Planctomycetota bacterium]